MLKLLSIPMIDHAVTDRNTHTSDHIITLFAFFAFSSSHAETRYIIPQSITVRTARTDIYCIIRLMKFHNTPYILSKLLSLLEHPGSPPQLMSGAAENTPPIQVNDIIIRANIYFILFFNKGVMQRVVL
jgi:hypothetical protein